MSTYKELRGLKVKYVPADTTSPSTAASGDVWYNSTTFQLKGFVGRAAWSAGSRYIISADHTAGTGTQTAALSASDGIPSPAAEVTSTYEYNGSGWASGGSMNTGRGDGYMNMAGTQTAAFYVGGRPNGSPPVPFGSVKTEEYNGSSWTETGDYPAGMRGVGAFGIQTAGVAAGGNDGPPGNDATATNNEYDGSSWTSGNNNNTARFNAAAFGTSTAGILVGGYSNPPATTHALTEEYDGSSWTESGDLPAATNGLAGGGIQTSGLVFGGSAPSVTTATLNYDGSSWTASPGSLGTARTLLSGAKGGTTLANLAWCGTPQRNITEEYNNSFQVVTAAAWASGGNMNTARYGGGGAGTSDSSALFTSGYSTTASPGYFSNSEEYNGSSWTEGPDVSTIGQSSGGSGTTEAAWIAGRGPTPGPGTGPAVATEEFNGSSWSAGGNMNTDSSGGGGCGTQTAALYSRRSNDSESYNGTAWTAESDYPSPERFNAGQVGTSTASVIFGGEAPSETYITRTEEWDGSSWTAGGDTLIPGSFGGGGGTQTDALQVMGWSPTLSPGRVGVVSKYDGTSWSTLPSIATARSSGGTTTNATIPGGTAIFGGAAGVPTSMSVATEEFTAETSADTASTIDFD